jgi:hypothetical protein
MRLYVGIFHTVYSQRSVIIQNTNIIYKKYILYCLKILLVEKITT